MLSPSSRVVSWKTVLRYICPSKNSSKAYVKALVYGDTFACFGSLLCCPFIKKTSYLLKKMICGSNHFCALSTSLSIAYTSLLAVTAFDRMLAVHYPFTYTKYYNTRSAVLLSAVVALGTINGIINYVYKDHNFRSPADDVVAMQLVYFRLLTIIFYIVITTSLYRQGRQISTYAMRVQPSNVIQRASTR